MQTCDHRLHDARVRVAIPPGVYIEKLETGGVWGGRWLVRNWPHGPSAHLHRRHWTPSRAERNRSRRGEVQRRRPRFPLGHVLRRDKDRAAQSQAAHRARFIADEMLAYRDRPEDDIERRYAPWST